MTHGILSNHTPLPVFPCCAFHHHPVAVSFALNRHFTKDDEQSLRLQKAEKGQVCGEKVELLGSDV